MDKKDTALTQLLRKLPSGIITDEEAFIFLKMEKQQIIEAVNINYENEKDHEKGEEFYKKSTVLKKEIKRLYAELEYAESDAMDLEMELYYKQEEADNLKEEITRLKEELKKVIKKKNKNELYSS